MTIQLIIKADENDGDYITSVNTITEEILAELKPIIKVVVENGGHWITGQIAELQEEEKPNVFYREFLTENQIELLSNYVPYGEYGVDGIVSIKVLYVEKEEILL